MPSNLEFREPRCSGLQAYVTRCDVSGWLHTTGHSASVTPPTAEITLSSGKLCLSLSRADCFRTLWNDTLSVTYHTSCFQKSVYWHENNLPYCLYFIFLIAGQSVVFRTHWGVLWSQPITTTYTPFGQRRQTAELHPASSLSTEENYGKWVKQADPSNLTSSVGSCPLCRKQNDVEARHPAVMADCAIINRQTDTHRHSEMSISCRLYCVSSPQLASGIPTDARWIGCAGHVARRGGTEIYTAFGGENRRTQYT